MTDDDYVTLARLLDQAAQADQQVATDSSDPVRRYQATMNAQFFTAARNAAQEARGRALGTSQAARSVQWRAAVHGR